MRRWIIIMNKKLRVAKRNTQFSDKIEVALN